MIMMAAQNEFRSLKKRCAILQRNASSLIWTNFIMQHDNDPAHKAFHQGKIYTVLDCSYQNQKDLNPTEHAFHLLKRKVKGQNPPTHKNWRRKKNLQYMPGKAPQIRMLQYSVVSVLLGRC